VSQAKDVLKCPLYPNREELNKSLRRQYGEDLDSFSTGKIKANWLSINKEMQRLKTSMREDIIKLFAPLVWHHFRLPADGSWTQQVGVLTALFSFFAVVRWKI
jgi:hypothetical protein